MAESYVHIELPDGATPSFITMNKPYFCTEARLRELEGIVPKGTATLLHETQVHQTDCVWKHTNIWGSIYTLRCQSCQSHHIWLSYNGIFYRCIQAEFTGLHVLMKTGKRWLAVDRQRQIWGNPEALWVDGDRVIGGLYVLEKVLDSMEAVQQDWDAFQQNPQPIFTEICNEIFGDG